MTQMIKLLTTDFQVDQNDIDKAQNYQRRFGGQLEQILVNMGSLSDDRLVSLYSQLLNLPILDILDWEDISQSSLNDEDINFFLSKNWIPLHIENDNWTFAAKFPLDLEVNQFINNRQISSTIYVCSDSDIQILSSKISSKLEISEDFDVLSGDEEEKLRELATEAPTVNLLNSLISRALRQGASDMHLEPFQGRYRARFRVDGVLHEEETLAPRMQLR